MADLLLRMREVQRQQHRRCADAAIESLRAAHPKAEHLLVVANVTRIHFNENVSDFVHCASDKMCEAQQ